MPDDESDTSDPRLNCAKCDKPMGRFHSGLHRWVPTADGEVALTEAAAELAEWRAARAGSLQGGL